MSIQNIQIKAKKISELEHFIINNVLNKRITDEDWKDHSYLLLGYNNGPTKRHNYKINLTAFLQFIKDEVGIDDESLLEKIQEFIDNNELDLSNLDLSQSEKIKELEDEIDSLKDELVELTTKYQVKVILNNVNITKRTINNTEVHKRRVFYIRKVDNATLELEAEPGYFLPNSNDTENYTVTWESANSEGKCIYNSDTKTIKLSNVDSNVTITINGTVGVSNTYYFGYLDLNDSAYVNYNVILDDYNEFAGIGSVEILNTDGLIPEINRCPFDPAKILKIEGMPASGADLILLVPKIYFDTDNDLFIDDYGSKYIITPNDFEFKLTFPYKSTTEIEGIQYYVLRIAEQYNESKYRFKKIND